MTVRAKTLAAVIDPRLKAERSLIDNCIGQNDFANLCWAACVEMAADQQKLKPPDIVSIAKTFLGCNQTDPCDVACDPNLVAGAFEQNLLIKVRSECAVEEQDLINQIESQNTVAIGWEGKPNHMVLVVGLASNEDSIEDSSKVVFLVCDPAASGGPNKLLFEEIETNYSGGGPPRKWERTWLDLRSK